MTCDIDAASFGATTDQRVSETLILLRHNTHSGVVAGDFLKQRWCRVRRAVIHYNKFQIDADLLQNTHQGVAQIGSPVEYSAHHGHLRIPPHVFLLSSMALQSRVEVPGILLRSARLKRPMLQLITPLGVCSGPRFSGARQRRSEPYQTTCWPG
jgi:hypothetical protein